MVRLPRRAFIALLAAAISIAAPTVARADTLSRGIAAFHLGQYGRALRDLWPLADRHNARALGLIGFMYENGFGVPQAYDAAADFYTRGAALGDPFSQAMLGLMYDKGHGVRQDFVLAYKWLNLAAAHTSGRQRDTYARFRNAVATKMSTNEIVIGQRLALTWTPAVLVPVAPLH
ncbi:tetratricopeptide repeat protein [Bradyrhizobium lablabi]|uniref:tetratricopeptide repeat protein n=1 Tax=Bradyrhizobium lablabi TaxID=722472 RepID=UPI001BA9D317|nr:tetratricopeptide repeat protein [Bradyrhizobium lablabi]MBR0696459.1 sel1 repeat family protein [Bradyrhizobium lablabi]